MRIVILALALVLSTPSMAALSVKLDIQEECYRHASVYLKLLRMVMDRKEEAEEEISPRLRAEFARTMRSASEWKTAIDAPSLHRGGKSGRSLAKGEARQFVVRLQERIRACEALVPS